MSETPILNRDGADHDPAFAPDHDPFGRTPPEGPNQPGSRHDPPSGSRARAWIAGGVAAAVLATGGFFGVEAVASHTKAAASASAGPGGGGFGGAGFGRGGPGGGGVVGTIKSINATSLVVTTTAGATETVTTTSATTATKAVTGAWPDIKAGDHVVVLGTGTSVIAASSITDSGANAAPVGGGGAGPAGAQGGPAAAGGGPAGGAASGAGGPPGGGQPGGGQPGGNGFGPVSGTVTDVGSGSLTVTETNGTKVTVTASSSTTVTTLETIHVSDLAAGQPVTIRGTTANGTVTATAIEEGAASFGQGGFGGPTAANAA